MVSPLLACTVDNVLTCEKFCPIVSSSIGDRDLAFKKSSLDSMPFPPGVGGSRGAGDASVTAQSYEVITAEKAIDENNVGNRMLRSMGWHEGLVLFSTSMFFSFFAFMVPLVNTIGIGPHPNLHL